MAFPTNAILCGDCIAKMNALPAGGIDLAFADPPFNIGYQYDVYDDRVASDNYLKWSADWIAAVYRVLKSDGAFWLAIGDEYAAELKLESQRTGFHCRSWVIWYYTFGVNCDRKFTRSHAHLFHFVKDRQKFTFRENEPENRIPSARQLVYNDKRANPKGRLPDDTWIIRPADTVGELVPDDETWSLGDLPPPGDDDRTWTLRPQDLAHCFKPAEDTWYFPRVAGTFKERAGFHGCQMPEQLLGRIIRVCSNEGEIVLDPFSGSATTAAVAKKLGRSYLAFDISKEYVERGFERLRSIRVGDPLDGSSEPLMTAPKTNADRAARGGRKVISTARRPDGAHDDSQLSRMSQRILRAFSRTYDGYSADRLVADPDMNRQFIECCKDLDLIGDARAWNTLLFRLRKAGRLVDFPTTRRTAISWEQCDQYLFASEIAWQILVSEFGAETIDEILCDPELARTFDETARRFAPGFTSLEYRWAALKLRKRAKYARSLAKDLPAPRRLGRSLPAKQLDLDEIPLGPGIYLLTNHRSAKLYAGETLNLRQRLAAQFDPNLAGAWNRYKNTSEIQALTTTILPGDALAWQSCLVMKHKPLLNVRELRI